MNYLIFIVLSITVFIAIRFFLYPYVKMTFLIFQIKRLLKKVKRDTTDDFVKLKMDESINTLSKIQKEINKDYGI